VNLIGLLLNKVHWPPFSCSGDEHISFTRFFLIRFFFFFFCLYLPIFVSLYTFCKLCFTVLSFSYYF
jgi:hypothetical protein